jgi:nicotinamide mononucleotide transporter
MSQYAEILATAFGLFYCILLIRENIWCWIFGILSSALSIYVFYTNRLYAESVLQSYYMAIGIFGWLLWAKKESHLPIREWPIKVHLAWIAIGTVLSFGLAHFLEKHTDSSSPMLDAHITIFSFIASYQEAKKILSTWLYWFVINASSVLLCWQRQLYFYLILSIVYTMLSVYGFQRWRKLLRNE